MNTYYMNTYYMNTYYMNIYYMNIYYMNTHEQILFFLESWQILFLNQYLK